MKLTMYIMLRCFVIGDNRISDKLIRDSLTRDIGDKRQSYEQQTHRRQRFGGKLLENR